jgi:hypothetical protein
MWVIHRVHDAASNLWAATFPALATRFTKASVADVTIAY